MSSLTKRTQWANTAHAASGMAIRKGRRLITWLSKYCKRRRADIEYIDWAELLASFQVGLRQSVVRMGNMHFELVDGMRHAACGIQNSEACSNAACGMQSSGAADACLAEFERAWDQNREKRMLARFASIEAKRPTSGQGPVWLCYVMLTTCDLLLAWPRTFFLCNVSE